MSNKPLEDKTIGLDIGHGENTFNTVTRQGSKGVVRNKKGYAEHHFNAAVGKLVEKRLKELGAKVVMAQGANQSDVPLTRRARIYDNEKVDILISIHANAGTASAKGMGVFYYKGSKNGKKLAELFNKHFGELVEGVNKWGKGLWESQPRTWSDFYMLRVPKAPAILLELGFMTNADDFEYIFGSKKDKYIKQNAKAIENTVLQYFGKELVEHIEVEPVANPKPQPSKPTEKKGDYQIKKGDTFYSIAQDMKIEVDALIKANPKVDYKDLKIGQWIELPEKKLQSKPQPKPQPKPSAELPVLRKGDKGKYVTQAQELLVKAFFYPDRNAKNKGVDGVFGNDTLDAVKRFQSIYTPDSVDGIIGKNTWKKLLEKGGK